MDLAAAAAVVLAVAAVARAAPEASGAATAAPRCPSETRCNLLEKSKSNLTKWSVLVLVTLFFLELLQIACNSVSGPGDLINYVSEAS
jgi:hypothetical protein